MNEYLGDVSSGEDASAHGLFTNSVIDRLSATTGDST